MTPTPVVSSRSRAPRPGAKIAGEQQSKADARRPVGGPHLAQLRHGAPALIDRERAPRVEDASRRGLERTRHLSPSTVRSRFASMAGSGIGTADSSAFV